MKHLVILSCILLGFCALSVSTAVHYDVIWWDTAVYWGMGKYLFSEGGFWESYRPPVLPVLYGMMWSLGGEWRSALAILFSLGVIVGTYLIGSRLWNKSVGLLAALFLALSPSFLLFSQHGLTEIPSTCLLLFGLYALLKRYFFVAGLLFGIASLTRFFQLFVIGIVCLILLIYWLKKKTSAHELVNYALGLGILHVLFMIANYVLYGNPLYPYLLQYEFAQVTAFIEHQPWYFYFIELAKENVLWILIPFIFFMSLNPKQKLLGLLTLAPFLIYTLAAHKEMRILLTVLPLLCIWLSVACVNASMIVAKKFHPWILLGVLVVLVPAQLAIATTSVEETNPSIVLFQHQIDQLPEPIGISNPLYALHSDKKIDRLLYYIDQDKTVDSVLYSSCDLGGNAPEYDRERAAEFEQVTRNLDLTFEKKYQNCVYQIYESTFS